MRHWLLVSTAVLLALFASARSAVACTGIRIVAKDGAVIYARTVEFGVVLPPTILAIPPGTDLAGALGSKTGLKWSAKYSALGVGSAAFKNVIADGLNEKGLGAGLFYHPGYAQYADAKPDEQAKSISPLQLVTYLLTSFATVKQAKAGVDDVVVAPVEYKEFGGVPPFHAVVHDAAGDSIVIEFLEGKVKVFDNPLGVITNSPTFDWHLTNLRNYVNFSATNVPPIAVGKIQLGQVGEGSGLLGMPGDYTPPSRFVRAVTFTQAALQPDTAEDAVNLAFHILNSFDIVKGVVRGEHGGQVINDFTEYTTAADLKNLRYYYRTYEDAKIRVVDLKKLNLSPGKVLDMPVGDTRPTFEDQTAKLAK
jgi:choloylglycine hydrolase